MDDVRGIPADSSPGDPGGGSDQAGTVFDPVRVPGEVKLMPHKHPENRVYTVMSGVFCVGLGEQCDGSKFERVRAWQHRSSARQSAALLLG